MQFNPVRPWPLLALLVVLASPGRLPCRGTEPTREWSNDDEKESVREDDSQIFETVLLNLLENRRFGRLFGDREKRSDIVLSLKTGGPTAILGLGDFKPDAEAKDAKERLKNEMNLDLKRRNPRNPIELTAFKPVSPKILLRDTTGLSRNFQEKFPTARFLVGAWLPGYSEDGGTAKFCAGIQPSSHGTIVTFWLEKKDGHWVVTQQGEISFL